ncbi:retinoid-inducible serine carboxypeptidase-like [Musca domestica]|uniref:Retinoid-inducible serine carboxypeptidase n=1 Tax=Musca domestica TaxID=7370 RepID=A0A1I8M708_MUSDO|nr:retinoid-inducible serine carboxypeptidase-like [Musca domestica]
MCSDMKRNCILLIVFLWIASVGAKPGYGPGEQDWGFVDVRPGGHMFYWLYYTTADVTNYTERPLAIWLQGGPGASATGRGNFEELGPLDVNGKERDWTWVKDMNVLFIDSPLGSGYSYVDNITLLPSTNNEIAQDLLAFMKQFYELHSEFEDVPLHIFSQSYGGKMAPEFALELYMAVERGDLRSNLKSVALGSPWTSPIDSMSAWGPLLLNVGIVDKDGYEQIMESYNRTLEYVENEEWHKAYKQWMNTSYIALNVSENVNFYNILKYLKEGDLDSGEVDNETVTGDNAKQTLHSLMLGPVSKALAIPPHVIWASQKSDIFDNLSKDFMRPAVDIVNEILNNTDIEVAVISGQLDLICATAGAVKWIEKLQWNDREEYFDAPRTAILIEDNVEGYEKSGGNFSMFWVNRAGHMIPADNPKAMSYILKKLTNYG